MQDKYHHYILIISFLFLGLHLNAQYIENGSFEGFPSAFYTSPHWYVCYEFSSPDLHGINGNNFSSFPHGVEQSPSDGETFVVLKARGPDYLSQPINTAEDIVTKLNTPLEKGLCYSLSVDMSYDSVIFMDSRTNANRAFPMHLAIYGGKEECTKDTLLSMTNLVDHLEWKRHTVEYRSNDTYNYLSFAPVWEGETSYNGVIYLDNVSLKMQEDVNEEYEHIIPVKRNEIEGLELEAKDGLGYIWLQGDAVDCINCKSIKITDPKYLVYEVFYHKPNVCAIKEKFILDVECPPIVTSVELDTIIQEGSSIQLKTTKKGVDYQWDPPSKVSCANCEQITVDGLMNPIQLNVSVMDEFNCAYVEEYYIDVYSCATFYPQEIITENIKANDGDIISLEAPEANEYYWQPNGSVPCTDCAVNQLVADHSRQITVEGIGKYNCGYTKVFNIEVPLFFPNAISPNGDEHNEYFYIKGLPPNSKLVVFNRMGKVLFDTDNYQNDWNGTDLQGKKLLKDTYWFVLQIPDVVEPVNGWIFVKP